MAALDLHHDRRPRLLRQCHGDYRLLRPLHTSAEDMESDNSGNLLGTDVVWRLPNSSRIIFRGHRLCPLHPANLLHQGPPGRKEEQDGSVHTYGPRINVSIPLFP